MRGWLGFERPMPDVFLACARRFPGRIVDVGANSGFYALIAVCAAAGNEVLAFEPDSTVLPILRDNIALNAAEARLLVQPVALSDEVGDANLYVPIQRDHVCVETSSSLDADFKGEHSNVVTVVVTTLDRFVRLRDATRWLNVLGRRKPQPITIVKIDVEGHERRTTMGCEATIDRHRPIVFVELLPRADFAYFAEFKRRFRYLNVRLRPDEAVQADAVVFDEQAWNHVFVPEERGAEFAAVLEEIGLPMRRDDTATKRTVTA